MAALPPWCSAISRTRYNPSPWSLVNYNHARIADERVSTAHVESTVNQLVNWRMCKKQQMRWSAAGAQLLLHVRTADLNGRLGHYVGRAVANDATSVAIAA
jgi:hypothetical protein